VVSQKNPFPLSLSQLETEVLGAGLGVPSVSLPSVIENAVMPCAAAFDMASMVKFHGKPLIETPVYVTVSWPVVGSSIGGSSIVGGSSPPPPLPLSQPAKTSATVSNPANSPIHKFLFVILSPLFDNKLFVKR
jgi:hypothetical protein